MATHPDPAAPDASSPSPAVPAPRRTGAWARLAAFVRIDAPGNQRGALSPAVAILAVMIFTLAGLVIDGGRQLGAKSRAVGYAQEAARVGAATIQLNTIEAKIDTTKAGAAVAAFCSEVSSNDKAVQSCGATELTDDGLKVQVVIGNQTTFLGMVGISHLDATGTGEAHAEQGVNKADDSPKIPPIVVSGRTDGPGQIPVTLTAVPPTLDLPCPSPWYVGSPTPIWTLPFPMPASCTPSGTPSTPGTSTPPTSGPTRPDPTDTQKTNPTPTKKTTKPGGGAPAGIPAPAEVPAPAGVPQNSLPPGAN
ncbi:TadE/TadG family type IV pilus assembly protein [Kribbella sp. NPDC051620]|uniref:TadE/TadG family type IV pilus assembly protein n=1 Tax=Kribbella sp. NPDC051620 TaxID=3364120 RepID=UPI0037B039DC